MDGHADPPRPTRRRAAGGYGTSGGDAGRRGRAAPPPRPAAAAARVAADVAQLRRERLPFVAVAWDATHPSRVRALVVGPLETPYAVRLVEQR